MPTSFAQFLKNKTKAFEYQLQRGDWIKYMWVGGNRGKIDFFKQSSNVIPFSTTKINDWLSGKIGNKSDIMGFDQPRNDIDKIKVHGRMVCVGSKYRNKLKLTAKKVLTSNFTGQELSEIKNLYIDVKGAKKGAWAGQHQGVRFPNGITGSIITIKSSEINNEDVLTHELVHAHRFATGRSYPFDRNREEKETDLETIARLSPQGFVNKTCGYYNFIPSVTKINSPNERSKARKEAQLKDRKCLTGSVSKKLKGKRVIKKVKECYPKSEIRKAHFSPAEQIDRYFLVKLPNGTTIQVHQWYPKGRKGKLTEIKKAFKKKYGTGIKAWEYRNGKKVRII